MGGIISSRIAGSSCQGDNPSYNQDFQRDTVAEVDMFSGFSDESFIFFRELAKNNSKVWFDRNRDRYEAHVSGLFRSLLYALEPSLLKLHPHFETSGKTNRNFSRINRDIRFSKDKSPYKSNYYLYVFDSRRDRAGDGRLYVGLSAECVTVGFSIYATWGKDPKGALETVFRPRFQRQGDQFRRLLDTLVRKKRFETFWHRQEKGEWVLHPGLPRKDVDWLTLQAWIVRRVFEPGSRGLDTPGFVKQGEKIFRELLLLYVFTSVSGPRGKDALTG
jgi:uncharacterized protein (TIGR02453 family)